MTVETELNRAGPFFTNGVTNVFNIPFRVVKPTDLKVFKVSASGAAVEPVVDVDFSIAGLGNETCSITYPISGDPFPSGYTISAVRTPSLLQETDILNEDGFYPEVIENALDYAVMQMQRVYDLARRSLRFADSYTGPASSSLPAPAADKVLAWDATGQRLVNRAATDFASVAITGSFNVELFDGGDTEYTLLRDPGGKANLDISVDGIRISPDHYSVSGDVLTFDFSTTAGTRNVIVKYSAALQFGAPADDTVATQSIKAGAVTLSKIADGVLGPFALIAEATTDLIQDAAVTLAKVANDVKLFLWPVGGVMIWPGELLPNASWAWCDGAEFPRSNTALYAVLGTTHGEGNTSTTANLPDYCSRFLRGADRGKGRDPDRATRTAMNPGGYTGDKVGTLQADAFKSHSHPPKSPAGNFAAEGGATSLTGGGGQSWRNVGATGDTGGSETRPINASVNFIIKLS